MESGNVTIQAKQGLQTSDAAIDPVTLEVIRHKLEGIANEMEHALLRSSFSAIVKEGLDASASLFTPAGETLAQALAIPVHLATLIPVVQRILLEFPIETMRDGDIYIMNDPYLGGTHLPDIALIAPVFGKSEKPIALAATMSHHQDVGGMSPGSIPTHATEIWQEGIRIPPLKMYDAGKLNDTLDKLLRLNVRIPDTLMGDLNGQVAGCKIGIRRLRDLEAVYGADMLEHAFESLLVYSERMTRQVLNTIPAGTYKYTGWLDNDGIDLDKRVKIQVAVTVGDGRFHVDLTGSSEQLRGPFNCVPSSSQAAAYFAVRALTDPNIPSNGGCFRPVTLNLPKGSLVNPECPAPVCSRTSTIKRITACILAAFKNVLPDRVGADSASTLLAVTFGGRTDEGKTYVVGQLIAGGGGASGVPSPALATFVLDNTHARLAGGFHGVEPQAFPFVLRLRLAPIWRSRAVRGASARVEYLRRGASRRRVPARRHRGRSNHRALWDCTVFRLGSDFACRRLSCRRRSVDHRASALDTGIRQLFRHLAAVRDFLEPRASRQTRQNLPLHRHRRPSAHRYPRGRTRPVRRGCGVVLLDWISPVPPGDRRQPAGAGGCRGVLFLTHGPADAQPHALVPGGPLGRSASSAVARQPARRAGAPALRIRPGDLHGHVPALRIEGTGPPVP